MKYLTIIIFSFGLLIHGTSIAHELRPAYLEITSPVAGVWKILWKQPIIGDVAIAIRPQISNNWLEDSTGAISHTETYLLKEWKIHAPPGALTGEVINIPGLEKTITDVLLRIRYVDGTTITTLIKPGNPNYNVMANEKSAITLAAYLQLGIEHILFGIDHLLFVLALLLLVANRKSLLFTISAFTLAHSITLALASLGLVHLQQAVVEAIIALSIVFVGVELIKHYQGQNGFTYRYPWVVAFVFGLLHGFGFAGALADVGLPDQDVPLALLLFNVGVEVGQLFFVGIAVTIGWLYMKWNPIIGKKLQWGIAYGIGSMAAYWFIERLVTVF
ncbi:HupE/UreJ family protein [Flavitalea antarctica]